MSTMDVTCLTCGNKSRIELAASPPPSQELDECKMVADHWSARAVAAEGELSRLRAELATAQRRAKQERTKRQAAEATIAQLTITALKDLTNGK